MIGKLKLKIVGFVFQDEGGKKVLRKKHVVYIVVIVFIFGVCASIIRSVFFVDKIPSTITKSDQPLIKEDNNNADSSKVAANTSSGKSNIGGVADHAPAQSQKRVAQGKPLRYKAKQVIGPDANADKIPSGTNFVGKLLTSIDTRSPQAVHVVLPYGGSHKSGGGSLPPDTILMGQFSYSGQSERVFLQFNRAVLPDGQEVAIQAQGLSSKDYRAGIIGDYHSNKGDQMASVLGLSMVGGISEVMVEKEGLGQSYEATPKATLKNGLYNGLAKVTQMEANNQAAQLGQTPNYVTIDSGADVIISLGESFIKNERQQ